MALRTRTGGAARLEARQPLTPLRSTWRAARPPSIRRRFYCERWPSGLRHRANCGMRCRPYRGFESFPSPPLFAEHPFAVFLAPLVHRHQRRDRVHSCARPGTPSASVFFAPTLKPRSPVRAGRAHGKYSPRRLTPVSAFSANPSIVDTGIRWRTASTSNPSEGCGHAGDI
jgi:hypothetical protein